MLPPRIFFSIWNRMSDAIPTKLVSCPKSVVVVFAVWAGARFSQSFFSAGPLPRKRSAQVAADASQQAWSVHGALWRPMTKFGIEPQTLRFGVFQSERREVGSN